MPINHWEFKYHIFLCYSWTDRQGCLLCGLHLLGVEVGLGQGEHGKTGSIQAQPIVEVLAEAPVRVPRMW